MTDVNAPAASVRRRRYLFRDLADGRGDAVCSALSAHDPAAEYRVVMSLRHIQPDWRAASALLFFMALDVAAGRDALFDEVRTLGSDFGPLPIALLTDCEDRAFLTSCYGQGISQVLHTSLSVTVIVQSLRLIAHGRAFVPGRLLIRAPSDAS